MKEIARTGP